MSCCATFMAQRRLVQEIAVKVISVEVMNLHAFLVSQIEEGSRSFRRHEIRQSIPWIGCSHLGHSSNNSKHMVALSSGSRVGKAN